MERFEWSDAWILVAAIRAAREYTSPRLEHLLGWADALNKAIPKTQELSGAFTRLVAAGLAIEAGGTIIPTRAGRWLYRRANWLRRHPGYPAVERVATRLTRIAVPSAVRVIEVPEGTFQSAFVSYSEEASRVAKKILDELAV